jgi:uncharacterized protein (DUF2141 family)
MLLHHALRARRKTAAAITFVSASTNRANASTTVTVTAPTGIQNGDLMVCVFYAAAASTSSLPSGFTSAYTDNTANNPRIAVGWKVAASESGNYVFTAASSTNVTASILVYRNATAFHIVGTINRAFSATATANSISPTSTGVLLASFSSSIISPTVSTAPSGMTVRTNTTGSTSAPTNYVYDQALTATGATGSRSLVLSNSGTVSGILFSIR